MGMKELTINALLIGLVIFAIIAFGIQVGQENYTNTTVGSNPSINRAFGNISQKLNESYNVSQTQREKLEDEAQKPIVTYLGFVFNSIVTAITTFITSVVGVFNIIIYLLVGVLGINPIVTGTLTAILIIALVLAAWRAWRQGE